MYHRVTIIDTIMAFSSFREGESDGMNHERGNKLVGHRG
jgi:hypothetical protein